MKWNFLRLTFNLFLSIDDFRNFSREWIRFQEVLSFIYDLLKSQELSRSYKCWNRFLWIFKGLEFVCNTTVEHYVLYVLFHSSPYTFTLVKIEQKSMSQNVFHFAAIDGWLAARIEWAVVLVFAKLVLFYTCTFSSETLYFYHIICFNCWMKNKI